jgi:hypothetical protein
MNDEKRTSQNPPTKRMTDPTIREMPKHRSWSGDKGSGRGGLLAEIGEDARVCVYALRSLDRSVSKSGQKQNIRDSSRTFGGMILHLRSIIAVIEQGFAS